MKKLALLLTAILLLLVFAGCQLSDSGLPETTGSTVPTTKIELPINKQTAIQIAMEHAGVTNDEVKHLHTRKDTDSGVVHYDVDFRHGEYYYAYEISERTGDIFKLETEHDRTELPEHQLEKEKAVEIALAHEGFTRDGVTALTVEFDAEDHRYEVAFAKDHVVYTYEICAEFGKILDIDKDWDD